MRPLSKSAQKRSARYGAFADALWREYEAHGDIAIAAARTRHPMRFLQLVDSVLSEDSSRGDEPVRISDEELERKMTPYLRHLGLARIAKILAEKLD